MLMHNDPLAGGELMRRAVERMAAPAIVPMDAYRRGDDVWAHIDLPGVDASSIDVDVERSVLTISAERHVHRADGDVVLLSERESGVFRRQVHLGDSLDPDGIEAFYTDGVLTLRIPTSVKAKPRKIAVSSVPASGEATTIENL